MKGFVSIAAEPCLPPNNFGKYDMPACDACAANGKNKGLCCNLIYRQSSGRDDDDFFGEGRCFDLNDGCLVGEDNCFPGLVCVGSTCTLPTDNPEAHAASSLLTVRSSSTSNTTKSGHFFVVVGLQGAAMILFPYALTSGIPLPGLSKEG